MTLLASAVLVKAPALVQDVVLAQAPARDVIGAGETVAFWILGPLALLGALGMVFARSAVHSALWLVLTMLSLGMLYMAQNAMFLGFTQIIVYTGAIMMLFLFVLMMVGRDVSDSVVEVLRGQRLAAAALGIGFALLLTAGLARSLSQVVPAPPLNPWSAEGGGAGGLGRLIFTEYLFPFELTSALLITAAVGAMVLSYGGKGRKRRPTQRETVEARFRGEYARPSPYPGPGVYATANSVATPALLPDGSVAPDSLSEILDNTPVDSLREDRQAVSGNVAGPDPHALTAGGADGAEHDAENSAQRRSGENRAGHHIEAEASGHTDAALNGSAANHGDTDHGDTNRGDTNGGDTNGNGKSADYGSDNTSDTSGNTDTTGAPASSEEVRK